MPAPVYILCGEAVIESKKNLVSVINLCEVMSLGVRDDETEPDTRIIEIPVPFQGIAVWMRSEGDIGKLFEARWVLRPVNREDKHSPIQPMDFSGEGYLHRSIIHFSIPLDQDDGVFWLQHQVREKGAGVWLTQQYPILVRVSKLPASAREPQSGQNTRS